MGSSELFACRHLGARVGRSRVPPSRLPASTRYRRSAIQPNNERNLWQGVYLQPPGRERTTPLFSPPLSPPQLSPFLSLSLSLLAFSLPPLSSPPFLTLRLYSQFLLLSSPPHIIYFTFPNHPLASIPQLFTSSPTSTSSNTSSTLLSSSFLSLSNVFSPHLPTSCHLTNPPLISVPCLPTLHTHHLTPPLSLPFLSFPPFTSPHPTPYSHFHSLAFPPLSPLSLPFLSAFPPSPPRLAPRPTNTVPQRFMPDGRKSPHEKH